MTLRPPKQFCNQTIIFKRKLKPSDDDIYSHDRFDDPITINNCVVHLRTTYSGTNSDRQITSNGTIVMFPGITAPFLSFTKNDLGSIIEYENIQYKLTNINEDKDPLSNQMYQWKLTIL